MNRGARQLPVFGDDADRAGFLGLLADAGDAVQFEVHGYALMPNHFHLLLRGAVSDVSAAMRHLSGRHAQRFNAKYGFDGPLWRSRFRSKQIDTSDYLLKAIRYIHRNPLPRPDASGVRLRTLRWTSHLAYVGATRVPRWLHVDHVLSHFGHDRRAFGEFVLCSRTSGDDVELDFPSRPSVVCPPDAVEAAVGVGSPQERSLLRTGGRGVRNDQRSLCVLLAAEEAGLDDVALAERYGFPTPSAARTALGRARERAETDPAFRRRADEARHRLGRAR